MSAGLSFASGNYVGIIDADLQDEPEILLEMYRFLLKEKVDIVYGVRTSRSATKFKRLFYFLFYRLYLYLADSPVQADSGDFCVMSRRAVRLLLSLPEKLRFVTRPACLGGIAFEAISNFAASSSSWLFAIFAAETNETGVLGPHIVFDKTIEGGIRVRRRSLSRCSDRCADLSWDRLVYRYSHRSTRVFNSGDHSALLQRVDLLLPGHAR